MYISYIRIYYIYACYAITLGTIGRCTPQCKNLVDYLEKWIHWVFLPSILIASKPLAKDNQILEKST